MIKVTKKEIIWNYLGIFMTLSSNLLILPFMFHYLNGDYLGLWYVFLSVGGIVILFDFGFNPTLARNITYCWNGAKSLSKTGADFVNDSGPNYNLLSKVIATCKKIYLIISLVAFLVLLTIGTLYIVYVSRDISGSIHIYAWLVYAFAVFLNLYYGYYTTLLRGVGAISQLNIAKVISFFVQIITSIILLYIGLEILAVTLAYLLQGIIFRLLSKRFFYKYKEIKKGLNKYSKKVTTNDIKDIFNKIWHNAWRDGMVAVSAYLSTQATVLICSMFLTLETVASFSISLQIITAIAVISGALYNTFQPALQSSFINNDLLSTKKIMSLVMTVYTLFYWFALLMLYFIGIPILEMINDEIDIDKSLVLILGIYMYLYYFHSNCTSYLSNKNRIDYMKAFIISSIFSIILSFVALGILEMGLIGLIGAQLLVQSIYNNWKWPYVVLEDMNTNMIELISTGIYELKSKLKKA